MIKIYYDILESTNDTAKEMAKAGIRDTVIIAKEQTKGRGQFGREFHSPIGGLYMSIILHSNDFSLITQYAADCVCDTIKHFTGLNPKKKWPNDIMLNNKKICGILTEAQKDWAVVGMGLNIYKPKEGFDKNIADTAGALFEDESFAGKNSVQPFDRNKFEDYLIKKIYEYNNKNN